MKVVTWNLGYWQFGQHHADAWAYLRDQIQPDIALLQEVCPPTLKGSESILFKQVHHHWGTAIYSRSITLEEIPLRVHPSRVVVACARTDSGQELHIASIHAPIIKNRVFPHLNHIFDEIESLFIGKAAVVGGDLNSARLAESVWPGFGHGPFFERIEAGPFFDCHRKFHQEEVQTFFGPKSIVPFQDDHLFVTINLADRVTACNVINNEITRGVSDHIPVVADIRI